MLPINIERSKAAHTREEPPNCKPMPNEGERVLALYRGEWIVLEVAIEYPTFEESFRPFKYWYEPFSDMLSIENYDVTDWVPLPEIPITP